MNQRLFSLANGMSFKTDSIQTLNFRQQETSKYLKKKIKSGYYTAAYVPNINSKQTLNFTTKQFNEKKLTSDYTTYRFRSKLSLGVPEKLAFQPILGVLPRSWYELYRIPEQTCLCPCHQTYMETDQPEIEKRRIN